MEHAQEKDLLAEHWLVQEAVYPMTPAVAQAVQLLVTEAVSQQAVLELTQIVMQAEMQHLNAAETSIVKGTILKVVVLAQQIVVNAHMMK